MSVGFDEQMWPKKLQHTDTYSSYPSNAALIADIVQVVEKRRLQTGFCFMINELGVAPYSVAAGGAVA